MRFDARQANELRPLTIQPDFIGQALGSALITTGLTRVICTANVTRTPKWLEDGGWVTGEYAMLPGATSPRGRRDPGGRGKEIQRLVGRSLRAAVDLGSLVSPAGGLSVVCDCDVIEADGGTRTASITGAYVALSIAIKRLMKQGKLARDPRSGAVAAVSVGLVAGEGVASGAAGEPLLDLCYVEDAGAVVDMNVVMLGDVDGRPSGLVEVQGTGEHGVFDRKQLDAMLDLAEAGISQLMQAQREAIAAADMNLHPEPVGFDG